MIRTELRDDRCAVCGVSLGQAVRYERENVVYESGEYADEGVEIRAFCHCGTCTTIPFSVNPKAVPKHKEGGNVMSETTKKEPRRIKVELVDSNYLTRWPCTVCGGCTEKVEVLAEAESGGIRVCETCLEVGNIDEPLEWHAAQLLKRAEWLQSLVGRLEVPTFAEWQDRINQAEDEMRHMYTAAELEPNLATDPGDIPF